MTKRKPRLALHVMPLSTPQSVTAEMCRVYRAAWNEKITPEAMHKYILALDRIRAARVAEAESANPTRPSSEPRFTINLISSSDRQNGVTIDHAPLRIEHELLE